jgi:hypothetical protein
MTTFFDIPVTDGHVMDRVAASEAAGISSTVCGSGAERRAVSLAARRDRFGSKLVAR